MASIRFTPALKRFFPTLSPVEIEAGNIRELVSNLDKKYPGLKGYLVDDQGKLRQHVNIFIGNDMIRDKDSLQDSIGVHDEIYIMQALSGG